MNRKAFQQLFANELKRQEKPTQTATEAMLWFVALDLAKEAVDDGPETLAHLILGGCKPLKLKNVDDWLGEACQAPGDDDSVREMVVEHFQHLTDIQEEDDA